MEVAVGGIGMLPEGARREGPGGGLHQICPALEACCHQQAPYAGQNLDLQDITSYMRHSFIFAGSLSILCAADAHHRMLVASIY